MKKVFLYVMALTAVVLVSCTGDTGPEGPPGPPGDGSEAAFGQSWEQDVDFQYDEEANVYSAFINIPDNVDYNYFSEDADDDFADNILVYHMGDDGEGVVFYAIPRTVFVENGTIQYEYNYIESHDDAIELTITGDFDLKNLSDEFVSNQSFRFAIVPSVMANDPDLNQGTFKDLENSGLELKKLD